MQQRCDSAGIVTNPSPLKRIPNPVHYDSMLKRQLESDEFAPIFHLLSRYSSSTSDHATNAGSRPGGYVCPSNLCKVQVSHAVNQEQHESRPYTKPSIVNNIGTEYRKLTRLSRDREPALSPPKLLKQSVKQYSYVDSLVDVVTMITNTLWPNPDATTPRKAEHSLRTISHFIIETSRKSKTSLSTMQLALLYCIRFKRDQVNLSRHVASLQSKNGVAGEALTMSVGSTCARRNFLSALILASKYLQDRNFSNKAWSKISSVSVSDINLREREFLEITKWNLTVKQDVFKHWSTMMDQFIHEIRDNTILGDLEGCQTRWQLVVNKMMQVSDDQMHYIVQCIASKQVALLKCHEPQQQQLNTPISTPQIEVPSFILPLTTDVSECSVQSQQDSKHGSDSPHRLSICNDFDEFVQSSPAADLQNASRVLAAAQYATPESMRTGSPTSPEYESIGDVLQSESQSATQPSPSSKSGVLLPTNDLLYKPSSLHVPSTPAMCPYTSFSLLTESFIEQQQALKRGTEDAVLGQRQGRTHSRKRAKCV